MAETVLVIIPVANKHSVGGITVVVRIVGAAVVAVVSVVGVANLLLLDNVFCVKVYIKLLTIWRNQMAIASAAQLSVPPKEIQFPFGATYDAKTSILRAIAALHKDSQDWLVFTTEELEQALGIAQPDNLDEHIDQFVDAGWLTHSDTVEYGLQAAEPLVSELRRRGFIAAA